MASVFLGDLNDFIQPSQACVNPMFVDTRTSASSLNSIDGKGAAKVSLKSDVFSGLRYALGISPAFLLVMV
jgi:hypothetical protein